MSHFEEIEPNNRLFSTTCRYFLFFACSYFHCSLIGYVLGLLTATVSSEIFKAAQPALLYLVPFTLLPLLTMAYLKVIDSKPFRVIFETLRHNFLLILKFFPVYFRVICEECGANRFQFIYLRNTWTFNGNRRRLRIKLGKLSFVDQPAWADTWTMWKTIFLGITLSFRPKSFKDFACK